MGQTAGEITSRPQRPQFMGLHAISVYSPVHNCDNYQMSRNTWSPLDIQYLPFHIPQMRETEYKQTLTGSNH